jgi:hypothetical protein
LIIHVNGGNDFFVSVRVEIHKEDQEAELPPATALVEDEILDMEGRGKPRSAMQKMFQRMSVESVNGNDDDGGDDFVAA